MQLVQGKQVYSLEQGFRHGQALLMDKEARRIVYRKLRTSAKQTFVEFKAAHPEFKLKKMRIVGISAAYYAAKAARIDCKQSVRASTALQYFKNRRDALVKHCPEEEAKSPVVAKKVAQEIANVVIFCEFFAHLVHPDSKVTIVITHHENAIIQIINFLI